MNKTLPALALALAANALLPTANAQTQPAWQELVGQLFGTPASNVPKCDSTSGKTQVCNVPAGYRAEFVRQTSQSACVAGKTMLIDASKVTVSGGCRAEFRLVPLGNTSSVADVSGKSGLGVNVERALVAALQPVVKAPQSEYGSLYDLEIINGASQSLSNGMRAFTGLAHSVWGGRTYPLDYAVRVDSAGKVLNADYRYANSNAATGGSNTAGTAWQAGSALDAEARQALAAAIEADYAKRSPSRNAQVVINDAFREQMLTRSEYRFTGRYGVSIDDGSWQTFRYEGRVFLPRNTVTELKVDLTP